MRSFVRSRPFDALLAFGIGAYSLAEIWVEHLHPKWVAAPMTVFAASALYWRRRYPVAVAVIIVATAVVDASSSVSMHTAVAPVIGILFASWAIGAYAPRQRAVLGLVVLVGGIWLATAIDQSLGTDHYSGTDYPWIGMLIAAPGVLGIVFGARTRSLQAAERRAEELERERLVAIAEERGRIARELHDVIAHSVSVMTVQAGAAEAMLGHDAQRALEPLRAVQETGRQTIVEMKRLVGMLREHDEELGLAPQPGLGAVDELLDQVREAGLPVQLSVEGAARPLPPSIDLSAYRIVQEALTNALKHAGRASATVLLRYAESTLEIEVRDDGYGANGAGGPGHGLAGMRERVAVFGGEFVAGDLDGGGFLVRALLPVEAVA